jgi:S-adenosylmethionine synthetase
MSYFFTSESVSQGHPDKVADQISDALVDNFIAQDPESHCAIETMVTTGQVFVAGEVRSDAYVDIQGVVRDAIKRIGYTKPEYKFSYDSCGVVSAIHEQSNNIYDGVSGAAKDDPYMQGAGDQGICAGYATNELGSEENSSFMPATLDIAHSIVKELAYIREHQEDEDIDGRMDYLRPDAKSQVTIEYSDDGIPMRIDNIVVSTSHDMFDNDKETVLEVLRKDVKEFVIPRVIRKYPKNIQDMFDDKTVYYINPAGLFVTCGPDGDCGLVGRKLWADFYSSCCNQSGALSSKDPSKVDRSAAYMARYIAKNCVAAGIADRMTVQISYAIGVSYPVGFRVDTDGTSHVGMCDGAISDILKDMFDCRPYAIEQTLNLRNPIYFESASYGAFGRTNRKVKKTFCDYSKKGTCYINKEVELFTWEKLDKVNELKEKFNLK